MELQPLLNDIESLQMETEKTSGTEVAYNEALKACVSLIEKHDKAETKMIPTNEKKLIKGLRSIYDYLQVEIGDDYRERYPEREDLTNEAVETISLAIEKMEEIFEMHILIEDYDPRDLLAEGFTESFNER